MAIKPYLNSGQPRFNFRVRVVEFFELNAKDWVFKSKI